MSSKNDANLGMQVNGYLAKMNVQTPLNMTLLNAPAETKMALIRESMYTILATLGLDMEDDSLQDTPNRVAKMYVNEIFSGLVNETFPKCTTVENKFCHGDEFVMEKDITLYSDCEHHLRPIIGKVHIAYIPREKVLGLSKLNRVAQYFASRPQVQERLTVQIAHAISFIVDSPDVIVIVEAAHTCVSQRGIKDTNSSTSTVSALGRFADTDSTLRREALGALK